ncbi:MAG TPA: ATPase domain-containing protein [Kofleriaceae bacterium]|jgi:circadian clock protein KaiC
MAISNASRITTGIPGLDPLLEGGLVAGGVYIVQGPPGSGKTILANQLCCHHARAGRRAIYFTLLSESHTGMFQHLKRMEFFCSELAGGAIVYFSGSKVLEDEGLDGLARLIGRTMADRNPTVLVIDGFMTANELAPRPTSIKQFIRQVQAFSASLACTTVLLSSTTADVGSQPEHTLADGIIELSDELNGLRSLRHLQIRKMRGTRQVGGQHTVKIDDNGMTVHARFEVGLSRSYARAAVRSERRGFGIGELDAMMMGGVPSGSITMLLGPSGVGKTLLALQFLAAGASVGEVGLYFGMYERPDDLLAKCKRIHLGLQDGVDAGKIHLDWERPIEGVLDVLADRMICRLRETGATRLCIDGMHTLFRTVDFPERMRAVTATLAEELSGRGVTTVYTLETKNLVEGHGEEIRVPIDDLSAMSHNIVGIRLIERGDQFDRMLSILKMRDSDYDRSIRELTITDRGIVLAPRERGLLGRVAVSARDLAMRMKR